VAQRQYRHQHRHAPSRSSRRPRGSAHHRILRTAAARRGAGTLRAARGCAITEAPRGGLYQRYETDGEGIVTSARIVPPTSQNQAHIEAELRALAPLWLKRPRTEATHLCEMLIRSYDPCISCSTHFLRLEVNER
jgi:coenzyme F420-reducing hydrogenase alpha subunit